MVNTVSRAARILDYLAEHDDRGVSEIARDLDMPKSSTYNILMTLEIHGLAERDARTGGFHLGIKLIELGHRAQGELALGRVARPFLQGLNAETDETIHLVVLDHDEVLYVDCVESRLRLRTYSVIGVRAPLYCTSVGKAILAWQEEAFLKRYLEKTELRRETDRTITDPEALRQELARIRDRGYAVDDREHEEHLRCVGAPIRNSRGEVFASLSLSGPEVRVTPDRIEELADRIRETTRDISRKLGFRG